MAEGFDVVCEDHDNFLMKWMKELSEGVKYLFWPRIHETPEGQNLAGVQRNKTNTPESDGGAVSAENALKSFDQDHQASVFLAPYKYHQGQHGEACVPDDDDKKKCFDADASTYIKHVSRGHSVSEGSKVDVASDIVFGLGQVIEAPKSFARLHQNDDHAEENDPLGDSDYFANYKNLRNTDYRTTHTNAKLSKKARKGKKRKRLIFGHIFRRRSCVIFLSIFEIFFKIFQEICKIPAKACGNLKKLTLQFRKLPGKRSVSPDKNSSGSQRAPVDLKKVTKIRRISSSHKNQCCSEAPSSISTEGQITTLETDEIPDEGGGVSFWRTKRNRSDTAKKSRTEKWKKLSKLAEDLVQKAKHGHCDTPDKNNVGERKSTEQELGSETTEKSSDKEGKISGKFAGIHIQNRNENQSNISNQTNEKCKFLTKINQIDEGGRNIEKGKTLNICSKSSKGKNDGEGKKFSLAQTQSNPAKRSDEQEEKQHQSDDVYYIVRKQGWNSSKKKIQSDTFGNNGSEERTTLEGNEHNLDKNSRIILDDIICKPENQLFLYNEDNILQQTKGNIFSIKDIDSILTFTLRAFNATGEVEVKLFQPRPAIKFKDERSRLASFNGFRTTLFAEFLAKSGFYAENNGFVQCFSCNMRHKIDEINADNSGSAVLHHRHCQFLKKTRFTSEDIDDDDVEPDGVPSDHSGDPPGQQSIYIPPGDARREQYRLSTFEQFRITDPSFRKALARSGFYFTGFYDRVKCFSCARAVEKWEPANDNPADKKWHKPLCSFFNKNPNSGNIPIRSLLGNLNFRQPSSGQDQVLQQTDVNTGQVIRTVRYPADLPERVRRSGGTFEIGPNNSIQIRSGNHQNFTLGGNRDQQQPTVPPNVIHHQTQSYGPSWRMANVASSDHKRFLTNLYLRREIDRLTSFARWPTDRPNVPPSALAKSGFFYLGDMDRVQCFSCGGVLRNWTLEDSAEEQHRIHFGGCRMVLGTETRNLPVPDVDETQQLRATNYPLRFPANPHMRGQAQREATFDRRWPTERLNVTTVEIAEAGFFYLGERDRVKCYYCNGGLQNWEIDDKPWDEHAKWFPNCQFLLRSKGQRFVHYHLSRNAELARPIIGRQDGSPLDPMGVPQVGSRGRDVPPREVRPPTPPPTIIDPQEEMRKRKERVKTIMQNSEVVKNVLAMGFGENIVAPLLEDRIDSNNIANPNDIYGSVSELLDDVMKKEEEIRQEEEQRRNQTASLLSNPSEYSSMSSFSTLGSYVPGSGKYNVSYFGEDEDMNDIDMYGSMEGASNQEETKAKELASLVEGNPEELQKQLDKIEEERMCKICFSNVADMLFSPCSHMVCCMECTQAIKHCPVCRKRIEKALKTYIK